MQKHKDPIYTGMLLSGTLNAHLEEVDKQAEKMLDVIINRMAVREGVTEQMKANDPLVWVGKMNAVQSYAEETIYHELISA